MRYRSELDFVLAAAVVAVLGLLLGLILPGIYPDRSPVFLLVARPENSKEALPIRRAAAMLRPESWLEISLETSTARRSMFAPIVAPAAQPTPAVPAPAPAPPPPATRKLELTYQGHIQDSTGKLQAFLRTGDSLTIVTSGDPVAAGVVVGGISAAALELLGPNSGTHSLPFREKKTLEIPAK